MKFLTASPEKDEAFTSTTEREKNIVMVSKTILIAAKYVVGELQDYPPVSIFWACFLGVLEL